MPSHIQLVLFGSPGVGKSRLIRHEILPRLGVDPSSANCIATVFHPEYGYGDFMGKLLPMTRGGSVEYRYYPGHFLRTLAQAYKELRLQPDNPGHVALVIDELNRGNSAAIFGGVFQLLDREADGWSCYAVNLSDMEYERLLELMDFTLATLGGQDNQRRAYQYGGRNVVDIEAELAPVRIEHRHVRIPPNLSIIATINTSDSSIYYMDAAFKRRWDWEFVDLQSQRHSSPDIVFSTRDEWERFVDGLNVFIRRHASAIRHIEDKQVGYWFINQLPITRAHIQNKLLFFLWDSVFARDRHPIAQLLGLRREELVSFGDLVVRDLDFVARIGAGA